MTIYFTNLMIMYSVILLKGNMLRVKCLYLPLYVRDMSVDHHRIYVYIWYFYHRHSNLWSIRSIVMSILCCLYMLTIFLSYVNNIFEVRCGTHSIVLNFIFLVTISIRGIPFSNSMLSASPTSLLRSRVIFFVFSHSLS